MKDCIFCKIVEGNIPSTKHYEDEHCYAFADANPMAPIHILIVPKKHVASLADLEQIDDTALAACLRAAEKIARKLNIKDGYRLASNCGANAHQSVQHLHFHLLAGEKLSPKMG